MPRRGARPCGTAGLRARRAKSTTRAVAQPQPRARARAGDSTLTIAGRRRAYTWPARRNGPRARGLRISRCQRELLSGRFNRSLETEFGLRPSVSIPRHDIIHSHRLRINRKLPRVRAKMAAMWAQYREMTEVGSAGVL